MVGVLGIDSAWTEKEPSGVALLEGSPRDWRCVVVAIEVGARGRGSLL
jgi:predicted RNase H-like nuclease